MDPVLETCILNMLQTVDNGQHSIHIINQPLSQTLRELIFIDVLDLLYEIFLLEVDLSVNINEGICYYSP